MAISRLWTLLAAAGTVAALAACSTSTNGAPLATSGSATLSVRQVPAEKEPEAIAPGALPAGLPGVVAPTCVNATPGWLSRELQRPGQVSVPKPNQIAQSTNPPVQGYLDRTYAACGESLGVHLTADTPTHVLVQAIRIGYYHGDTGRVVWQSAPVEVGPHPTLPVPVHVTEDNAWPTSLTITPRDSWAPGLYLIRFRALGRAVPDTYQPLYVLSSGQRAAYLAIGADLTQLAYNKAGGTSLYFGPGRTIAAQHRTRAYIASTHRALLAAGLSQLLSMDVPLAEFFARHQITADWTSDMSLDGDPTQAIGRATIVIPGHSEYWTRRNYDTLTHAVRRGTNLAVLGGNEIYWQTRLRRDAAGNVASMAVYRTDALDPVDTAADKTTEWRNAPLNRDPASLTGLGMSGVGIDGDASVVSTPGWLFRGTGLQLGNVLPHLYGNEGDGPKDVNTPANLEVLFRTTARANGNREVFLATAYHSTKSGAGVFDAGTTEWLCEIDNRCSARARPTWVRHALDRLTLNLLTGFAVPKAGRLYPSEASG